MKTLKYIQQEMPFIERDWSVAPEAPPAPLLNQDQTASRLSCVPSTRVIDFYEASDRLREGCGESEEFAINRNVTQIMSRRIRSVNGMDRLEESLYWLISGSALFYLLVGIIGG